ncbi:MAG: hypothetical protein GY860_10445 [Desulfobacteraceae bacterium]|nr:hypothetical protein [Desulfobacteraceae bacterium]
MRESSTSTLLHALCQIPVSTFELRIGRKADSRKSFDSVQKLRLFYSCLGFEDFLLFSFWRKTSFSFDFFIGGLPPNPQSFQGIGKCSGYLTASETKIVFLAFELSNLYQSERIILPDLNF